MKSTNQIKAVILKNEDPFDHKHWITACEHNKNAVSYKVVDLTKENWLFEIQNFNPDILLLKPSGKTSLFRSLYQERLDILVNDLNYKTFPSYAEARIYENKRFFAYWALANNIPHPKTYIFYFKKEAITWAENRNFPIVGKMNIGASGNGIVFLKTKLELLNYINKAFSVGLTSIIGPKLSKGKLMARIYNKILHPKEFLNRIQTYKDINSDRQKGFVILQDFVPHNFEWRAVRIGKSFFAHKKIRKHNKASGSLIKEYEKPSFALLDFVKELTDRFDFRFVAIDIFETTNGDYLVNEIQCIFGQSDPYQMLVEGKPGKYIFDEDKWIFQEGDYAKNSCFNLRLEYVIENLNTK